MPQGLEWLGEVGALVPVLDLANHGGGCSGFKWASGMIILPAQAGVCGGS